MKPSPSLVPQSHNWSEYPESCGMGQVGLVGEGGGGESTEVNLH